MLKPHNSSGLLWFTMRLTILSLFLIPARPAKSGEWTSNSAPVDALPELFSGTIYAKDSGKSAVLFSFQRSAIQSGSTVRVECKYQLPDGSNAAVEHIVYKSGHLVSYDMEEMQAGLRGSIQVKPDPKNPTQQKIVISYGSDAREKSKTEDLSDDTLIDDTVYPFILSHWDDLMRGETVKCRLVALENTRTFGFKLSKATETLVNGNRAVVIRMEPASLIVARFVDPIYISVEKNAPHRILEFVGRTIPRIKVGKSWKYLEADTVFDWK